VLSALKYCHKEGFAHRDLKPNNILIGEKGIPVLCDFGFAKKCEEYFISKSFTNREPIDLYISPEVKNSRKVNWFKVDM